MTIKGGETWKKVLFTWKIRPWIKRSAWKEKCWHS